MNKNGKLCANLLLLISSIVPAAAARADELSTPPHGQLWLGLTGGYTHIAAEGSAQTSKNGYHLFVSGSFEWLQPDWTFAMGGGLFYNRVYSGGERNFATDDPALVAEQRNLRIETRAGSAELATRYRLWGGSAEAGLLLRSLFGSSLSFSQDKDAGGPKFLVGPQVILKTSPIYSWMQRLEASLLADLNIPHRQVYLLSAGIAFGQSWKPSPEAPAATEPDRFEEILADKVINFPSASSELRGAALSFLKELGLYLQKHPDLWLRMDVEGHTDKKGKLEYNTKLSQDRAETVRQTLLDQGVDSNRLSAQGFGPTKPLKEGDSPDILALNRRVVMIFQTSNRAQRNELSAEILRLRKKHFGE